MDHVDHQLELRLLLLVVGDVLRFAADCCGLGPVNPLARHLQLPFDIADRFEILVDALPIRGADLPIKVLRAIAHEVEHAAAFVDAM